MNETIIALQCRYFNSAIYKFRKSMIDMTNKLSKTTLSLLIEIDIKKIRLLLIVIVISG